MSYTHTGPLRHSGCCTVAKGVSECIPEAERGKREEERLSSCLSHLSEDGSSHKGRKMRSKMETPHSGQNPRLRAITQVAAMISSFNGSS